MSVRRRRETEPKRHGAAASAVPVALILALIFVLLGAINGASAQVIAPIETPYTKIDTESRTQIEVGAEAPLKGNGPPTGYAYGFLTRPHFLDKKDLYLRAVIAPVYAEGELIHDHWPSANGALGLGVGGGLFVAGHTEFRGGGFDKAESFAGHLAEATFAYYLRGPTIAGMLPLEGQIRVRPTYVVYARSSHTSGRFRLPEDSAIYNMRAGIRLGGVPPDLFPGSALELSLWHQVSYRETAGHYGLPERPQQTKHLTQKTWLRVGGIFSFRGTQASAFLNAGIAEDTDALSAFRLGGGLRLRAEFPLLLHGYNLDEILARAYCLVNFSYRFPIWPGQNRVTLQLLADYAQVDYAPGYRLPRNGLAGVGANLSVALSKRMTLVAGYGYGIDAPRGGRFGGHEIRTLFEFKY